MVDVVKTTTVPYNLSSNHELVAIIPHATNTYDPPLRAIYVGGAGGNVALTAHDGNGLTSGVFTVVAGSVINGLGSITVVLATGTTATGLIGVR